MLRWRPANGLVRSELAASANRAADAGCPRAAASLANVLEADADRKLSELPVPADGEIVLIVGPEGGISPDERAAFAAVGAVEGRLGDTVLRTSTAGVAAAAVVFARTSRW